MPPQLALLLYFILVLCLFIMDSKRNSEVSLAIWIPLIWVLIISSRMVSLWLDVGSGSGLPDDYLEGSPIDRNIFTSLFIIAAVILFQRKISWSQLITNNVWIFIYLLYCGISVIWSDFPWVSLKRYGKEIGNLLIVLVVLTERDPMEALKTILRRCAYVLIPLSIVLYKYYAHLGRSYGRWTGELIFTG